LTELAVEATGLTKYFEAFQAVDHVTLQVPTGSIYGVLGPNGAGKTTSLRMTLGIIDPDEGTSRLLGGHKPQSVRHRIGYLPEERGLYPGMKAREAIAFMGALRGLDWSEGRRRAATFMTELGLERVIDDKIRKMSKGMAQMVQLIGSIVHAPDLIVLDEPFSGLDPLSQDILLEAMLELKAAGVTVLFSTHIMEHAEKICERILLVNHGREIVSGALAEVKSRHGRNAVQIEFDGDASFIDKLPCVESVRRFPRWIEAQLRPGADSDELYRALAGRLKVRRFEVVAPSLHKIFISLVGDTSAETEQESASADAEVFADAKGGRS